MHIIFVYRAFIKLYNIVNVDYFCTEEAEADMCKIITFQENVLKNKSFA